MSTTNVRREDLPALSPAQRIVAAALAEMPDATVTALSRASRTSKSTVAKTLLKMEQAGAARRTLHEDAGTRLADTWSPTVLTGSILVAAAAKESGYGHAAAPSASSDITHASDAASTVTLTAPEEPVHVTAEELTANECEGFETTANEHALGDSRGDHAADAAEVSSSLPNIASPATELIPGPAELAVPTEASSSRERLAPGVLGAMVAAHLMAHPEMDFTPTELSRVLGGKSAGAIYNALVKMKEGGTVIQTCESPRRFRQAPCAEAA